MKLFTRFKEAEAKTDSLLDIEWRINKGGYMHLGRNNWTFAHRIATRGVAMLGTQEEFIVRGQVALDFEKWFSWITLELMNLYDARIIYVRLKLWRDRNLKVIFNLGWRLSSESRRYLQNQVADQERRKSFEMRKNMHAVQGNGTHKPTEVI